MRRTRPRPDVAGPVGWHGAGTRCSRPRSDPGRWRGTRTTSPRRSCRHRRAAPRAGPDRRPDRPRRARRPRSRARPGPGCRRLSRPARTASRSRRRARDRPRPYRRTCRRRPRDGAPRRPRRRLPRAPQPGPGRSCVAGSTRTARRSRMSTTSAPSAIAWPATLCPPPRTAIGSPRSPAAIDRGHDVVIRMQPARSRPAAAGSWR